MRGLNICEYATDSHLAAYILSHRTVRHQSLELMLSLYFAAAYFYNGAHDSGKVLSNTLMNIVQTMVLRFWATSSQV